MNIKARLEKLEQESTTATHWVWVNDGETVDNAITRHRTENPNLPTNANFIAVSWLQGDAANTKA